VIAALTAAVDAARVVSEQARKGLAAVTPAAWEALDRGLGVLDADGPRDGAAWGVVYAAHYLFSLMATRRLFVEDAGPALLRLRDALDALDEG
jgi:hypothetical protein